MKKNYIRQCFYAVIAVLSMSVLPASSQNNVKVELGPNVVKNSGFEEGASHWGTGGGIAKVVEGINGTASSGRHSLHYTNTDIKQYKLLTQNIDVRPGQRLHYSAWIKGEDVRNAFDTSNGAGAFIESYDGSKFVGGAYARTILGTFDWQQVKGIYIVPQNATRTLVGLYLRKNATGSVWFDDVEVREELPDPFFSTLQYPNYRGMVAQGDNLPWKVAVRINKQDDWKENPIVITHTLVDANGKVLLKKSDNVNPTEQDTEIVIGRPQDLSLGDYTLKQSIIDPNGKSDYQTEYPIKVVSKMPKTYIDSQGFTVLNEERFFPMGLFLGAGMNGEEDMERIADGGFNTILSYNYGANKDSEAYMDRAQKHNLKVVYSLKDMYPGKANYGKEAHELAEKYINNLRDKPALLAWYTNDEMGTEWLSELDKRYEQVKQLDPNHLTLQVQDKVTLIRDFFAVSDVLATDPYPVGNANLSGTSNNTRIALDTTQNIKGMWIVPQMMDWAVYREADKPHPPSLDEMRNQAYQAIINGATGLIWYSYYDLMWEKHPRDDSTKNMDQFHKRWKDAVTMAKEINQTTPVVLANKKVLLDVPAKSDIEAAAWQDGNELLLLMANPYYEQKSISFELPVGWKIKDANQGQIKSTFANGKATFILSPIGSGVFRLVK